MKHTIELYLEDQSPEEIHAYLKEALNLPEHYGMNLDALHDCLTSISEETEIEIEVGAENEYIDKLIEVFCDSTEDNENLTIIVIEEEYYEDA